MTQGIADSTAPPHARTRVRPAVSIVVPAHQATADLPRLLAALRRQTAAPELFELIVVDDRSTDGTPDLVRADGLGRVVEAPERRGSYVARNLGIAEALGDVIAFTDADCDPAPDWVERGLAAMADPDADVVAGRIAVPLGERPTATAMLDSGRFLDQERYVSLGFGATANLWVRRRVFDRLGPFNPGLISSGDYEFGQRVVAAGARLVYAPDVVISHEPRRRPAELARKNYRIGYGAAQCNYHAEGELRDRPRVWLHPGAYIPHREIMGLERLREAGIHPNRAQRLKLLAAQYGLVKLPSIWGNFRATIHEERAKRARGRR